VIDLDDLNTMFDEWLSEQGKEASDFSPDDLENVWESFLESLDIDLTC
jgi:hypothetical protein